MSEMDAGQSSWMSRRGFCRSVAAVAVGLRLTRVVAAVGGGKPVKFFKNFAPGHLGIQANQRQALEYAVKYGFEGIAPSVGEFRNASDGEIDAWLAKMKEAGVQYGAAGLSTEFRRDDARFRESLAQLPREAGLLRKLGVTRVATWITPGSSTLTYMQNFKLHETRLREAAKVLDDHGIRLGLEFVGPRTSRSRSRFAFISTQAEMMELCGAIGTPNMGLLMDSWHWYTSHGTVEELLRLSNKDIVHVHVNDAPAGIEVDQQMDNRRKLPAATGVIDMKGFLNALVKIGYDGPVECEPFDQELRDMDDDAAARTTIESLNRAWALIES